MTAYEDADRTHQAQRINRLIKHLRAYPNREIRTGTVRRLYDAWGIGPKRSTAKGDLQALRDRGLLTAHGPANQRHYRLTAKAAA